VRNQIRSDLTFLLQNVEEVSFFTGHSGRKCINNMESIFEKAGVTKNFVKKY